jgi:hypothetical protein
VQAVSCNDLELREVPVNAVVNGVRQREESRIDAMTKIYVKVSPWQAQISGSHLY